MREPTALGKRPSFQPHMSPIAQAKLLSLEKKNQDTEVSKSDKLSKIKLKLKKNKKRMSALVF